MEQVGVAPSRTLRSRDTRCCPSSSLGHISRATWPPYPSSAWHWGRWQGWARRGCRPVTTPSWCAVPPNSLWQGAPWWHVQGRCWERTNWAAPRSMRATVSWMMKWSPRLKPSLVRAGFFRTCPRLCMNCHPGLRAGATHRRIKRLCGVPFRKILDQSTRSARSWKPWWIAARSWKSAATGVRPLRRGLGGMKGGRGLSCIDGWAVVVVASDPYHYGGAWDRQTTEKYMRMVDLAEQFHLPVLNLVDVPGFRIGLEAEKEGVMRAGVRALTAVTQSTVPWCTVILRKAFGVAGGGHQNADRFNFRYAWPSAQWGSLPIEGGLEVAYKAEIEAASDQDAARERIEARVRDSTSPFRSAGAFVVGEINGPQDTRALLVEFANVASPLREAGPVPFASRPRRTRGRKAKCI